jgi:hypothetical protein
MEELQKEKEELKEDERTLKSRILKLEMDLERKDATGKNVNSKMAIQQLNAQLVLVNEQLTIAQRRKAELNTEIKSLRQGRPSAYHCAPLPLRNLRLPETCNLATLWQSPSHICRCVCARLVCRGEEGSHLHRCVLVSQVPCLTHIDMSCSIGTAEPHIATLEQLPAGDVFGKSEKAS